MLALSSMEREYKAGWTQLWLSRQRELLISDGLAYKPLGRASRTCPFLEGKAAHRYETLCLFVPISTQSSVCLPDKPEGADY